MYLLRLAVLLGVATMALSADGPLDCKSWSKPSVTYQGYCEVSFSVPLAYFGQGTSTQLVAVRPKSDLAEAVLFTWGLNPPIRLLDGHSQHVPAVSRRISRDLDGNVVTDATGAGDATMLYFGAGSLEVSFVAPVANCDKYGESCSVPMTGNPTQFRYGSILGRWLSTNPEALRGLQVPSFTLNDGQKVFSEKPDLAPHSSVTTAVVLGGGKTTRIVLLSENTGAKMNPTTVLITRTGDDGLLLGTRILEIPAWGGIIGSDLSDPMSGFGPQDKVTNGTFTVSAVNDGEKFFISGWNEDETGKKNPLVITDSPAPAGK